METHTLEGKLHTFADLFQAAQRAFYVREYGQFNAATVHVCNWKVYIHMSQKYARVDAGSSGRYMVVIATGEIFGVRASGVIDRKHAYGTLDTISEWIWGDYYAQRKPKTPPRAASASELEKVLVYCVARRAMTETQAEDIRTVFAMASSDTNCCDCDTCTAGRKAIERLTSIV